MIFFCFSLIFHFFTVFCQLQIWAKMFQALKRLVKWINLLKITSHFVLLILAYSTLIECRKNSNNVKGTSF